MGYVKYNEDDIKINSNRNYMNNYVSHLYENEKELVVLYNCPYCEKSFDSKEGLFQHIKHDHNKVKPIVIINNRIVIKETDYYVQNIESVIVHTYDLTEKIFIDGKETNSDGGLVDLTIQVKTSVEDNRKCAIEIGKYKYNVLKYSLETIQIDKIYNIVDQWQKSVENDEWIDKYSKDDINEAEKRLLDGFYDYFLACKTKGREKKLRYEDAYYLLSSFDSLSGAALCVLKIIAFRWNWINVLDDLCQDNDEFRMICDFYLNKKSTDFIGESEMNHFYIEDDLLESMNAIISYVQGKTKDVDRYIRMMKDRVNGADIKDINLLNRYYVLMSRRGYDLGNDRQAGIHTKIVDEFLKDDFNRYVKYRECEDNG